MRNLILITGGAGFIGSHLADGLLQHGHTVRILDNLTPQVHGPERKRPAYLNPDAELCIGDVCDPEAVERCLKNVDVVFHLAAAVGVGQSMYEIAKYTNCNNMGTAVLLESITRNPIRKLIISSSMSIYGEGLYACSDGSPCGNASRAAEQLKAGDWEPCGPAGERLTPIMTPESKTPSLASVYALSKYDQEQMSLIIGRTYNIPVTALRFFNVFGTRQALSNPYTGVLAIFASRYLNNNSPLIYEDGLQRRDFVSVRDIVQACLLAMETPASDGMVLNIGSGRSYTVRDVAQKIGMAMGKAWLEPRITGKYRKGDIRHCFADISLAQNVLKYNPSVMLDDGLDEVIAWLEGQVARDRCSDALEELNSRGLTV